MWFASFIIALLRPEFNQEVDTCSAGAWFVRAKEQARRLVSDLMVTQATTTSSGSAGLRFPLFVVAWQGFSNPELRFLFLAI
jgi:hypothetical protein